MPDLLPGRRLLPSPRPSASPGPSPSRRSGKRRVTVAGIALDQLSELQVADRVVAGLKRGKGGHVVTPNVDIARACARDVRLRDIVRRADIAVADGMPLVWAARVQGTPLPGRVTGADLIWSLSEAAAFYGFPVYLVGGEPGVAEQAAAELRLRHPALIVAGVCAPPYGFDASPCEVATLRAALVAAAPSLVFVGLGFPRQDLLIEELRPDLPATWFVGCGSAIAFAAGALPRAPAWMRDSGLEWFFRLATEPRRLARRYLAHDLPFALRLLTLSLLRRLLT
ncbi:WecB/TagA/CpsF family glycosyltransferase [Streptosporangiaceae bacterium NEAU-GS5]|nr:WecB/TagA/CpsF family glycosyltransferase [Streptosporangiaceae bacterium NEAU-GS5]